MSWYSFVFGFIFGMVGGWLTFPAMAALARYTIDDGPYDHE